MSIDEPAQRRPDVANLDVLKSNLTDVIAESKALRRDVAAAEAGRKRANAANLALLAMLLILVGMGIIITWQNNNLVYTVNRTNSQMADCTNPGGKCYAEGTVRTAHAINDIIRAEVYIAECSRLYPGESGPAYDRKLEQCVYGRLAQPGTSPSTSPNPSPSTSARTH